MDLGKAILSGALVVAIGAAVWLQRDNDRLRDQLAARDGEPVAAPVAKPVEVARAPAEVKEARPAAPVAPRPAPAASARERPKLPEAEPETRGERRDRRQREVAAMFGRLDGETEDEYRERMVPFIEAMLSRPRDRVAELRSEAEREAEVTDDQRAALDEVLDDVRAEVLELTNQAIATGELTPYSRNWAGALGFAGGVGAILNGAEGRIGSILSPEQTSAIYDSGFEWGEYLAATVPWESLTPPPPP